MSTGSCILKTALLVTCIAFSAADPQTPNKIWNWKCDIRLEACTRTSVQDNNRNEPLYPSIETCRLICGKYGALWPQPTVSCELGQELLKFGSVNIVTSIKEGKSKMVLQEVVTIFQQLFSSVDTSSCPEKEDALTVHVHVNSNNLTLDWSTNENYHIQFQRLKNQSLWVDIVSGTIFGARHALETLSQLIEVYPNNDGSKCLTTVTKASITDSPIYPHRGLLLDTARNFLSIPIIKNHINAMATSKMNILHWHITDSQSFPLELPSLPNMTKYGAYSKNKIYHPEEIQELLHYAKLRGVRIVIEIDAPAHAGQGWQWGPEAGLGNLAVCVNQHPWRSYCIQPPCGQLNPVNPKLHDVLKTLYRDITNMLPKGEIFHMGGDEVYIPCWNSTPEIIQSIGSMPRTTATFLDLWSDYQNTALEDFDAVAGNKNTPIILWTSQLTQPDVIERYLPKDRYVIQAWVPAKNDLPTQLLALGYRVIFSTKDAWYLDHGFRGGTIYHDWQTVYNNRIQQHTGALGGEVCMWGEYVDDNSVETRTWPRAAAAAERLWSDPYTKANNARNRFLRHRERLISRGIKADAVTPKWCYQNERAC